MGFKIDFDIKDYKDILPEIPKDEREIINYQYYGKPDLCVWKKEVPQNITGEYREREVERILRTGAWMALKDEFVWLPPSYYFGLSYGTVGELGLEFRLKRLKHVYHKIRARNNAGCMGTLTMKNRADGETTMAVTDAFWECLDGNMKAGMIGIQSKTRADVKNPCWLTVQTLWLNLPKWIKDELCSDFASGENIAEKLRFIREADELTGRPARNIVFEYFPAVFNAMDGRHNMKKCILDEICKWVECEFIDAYTNYKKFIMPGFERRGLFDMFSSPADADTKSNQQVYELWKQSDPNNINPETGTTLSRVHRYYSNPLDGIQGAYDKWGDADPNQIYEHIMRERKQTHKDKLLAEIRGFPLNEDEMFGSHEGGNVWSNSEGMKERKLYIISNRFKDEKTKEPIAVFGNLEWKGGVVDNNEGVDFRQADVQDFDVHIGRFKFSHILDHEKPLDDVKTPPLIIQSCLGVDPFGKRYPGKRFSNGAAVNWKFRDIGDRTGIINCPTMTYCNRPQHEDIFFEDMIKACVFNQSMMQYENVGDKIAGYFEDRGYFDWLLPSIGEKKGSKRTGDAPNSSSTQARGKFIDEGISLIDAITNTPMKEGDTYWLLKNWHSELIEDALKLNLKDTHEQDLTMAWIQAMVGAAKMMYIKQIPKTPFNNEFIRVLAERIW